MRPTPPRFPVRTVILGLALAAAGLALPRPARAADEPVDLAMLQRIRDEGLQRSQVMDWVTHLTDVIGPRLTGSPQMKAANEWTRAKFAEWGLQGARLESWGPFGPGWSLQHAWLRQVSPAPAVLVAWPRAWSPGTDGPVRGGVVHAPIESEAEIANWKGKLAGKIVLLSKPAEIKGLDKPLFTRRGDAELAEYETTQVGGRPPERMVRFRQRRRLGAALHRFLAEERPLAAIYASQGEGGVLNVAGVGLRGKDDPRGVPQLTLLAEQYNGLVRRVQRGEPVELELDVRATFHEDDLMAYNTLAELPGNGPKKDEVVILGAHLDSWHAGTGATDNATGSAVVMEAMRILSAVGAKPRRTIRAALWSGEEQGLLGSRAYVTRHFATRPEATDDDPQRGPLQVLPEHARVAAYFNIDGGTGRVRAVLAQENIAVVPVFQAWIRPLRDLGVVLASPRRDFGTDHNTFDAAGLPGFNFLQDEIEYDTLTHHTQLDVLDRVRREDLVQAAVVMAAFAWQAAQRDEMLPRKPLPPPNPPRVDGPTPAGASGPR
jgi:hypothetical protein